MQFHFVCDKLDLSILDVLLCLTLACETFVIIAEEDFFITCKGTSVFVLPRIAWGLIWSYEGMGPLRTFGSAPLTEDPKREQVIIGLQTGSGANLSFYILGENDSTISTIFDQMDLSLQDSMIEIDGKEIVITSYMDGFEHETSRFKIDNMGNIIEGHLE